MLPPKEAPLYTFKVEAEKRAAPPFLDAPPGITPVVRNQQTVPTKKRKIFSLLRLIMPLALDWARAIPSWTVLDECCCLFFTRVIYKYNKL